VSKFLFFGEFDLVIDPKNRLSVPMQFRKRFDPEQHGSTLFITPQGNTLWLYPEKYYEQFIYSKIQPEIAPTPEIQDFQRRNLGMADSVEWDAQGRIVLQEKMLNRAKLGKDVTLIGNHDHLELWDRAAWQTESERLIANSANNESKVRDALKQQPPAPQQNLPTGGKDR